MFEPGLQKEKRRTCVAMKSEMLELEPVTVREVRPITIEMESKVKVWKHADL